MSSSQNTVLVLSKRPATDSAADALCTDSVLAKFHQVWKKVLKTSHIPSNFYVSENPTEALQTREMEGPSLMIPFHQNLPKPTGGGGTFQKC